LLCGIKRRDFSRHRISPVNFSSIMKVASYEAIVRALNDSGVPFPVVGGLAAIAHGTEEAPMSIW
jgi:hypothetical protein